MVRADWARGRRPWPGASRSGLRRRAGRPAVGLRRRRRPRVRRGVTARRMRPARVPGAGDGRRPPAPRRLRRGADRGRRPRRARGRGDVPAPGRRLARRSPARERLQDRAGRNGPPARVPPDARRHAHLARRRGPPPPRPRRRSRRAVPGRAQRVATYAAGAATTDTTAIAGDIATVVGLPDAEIGDQLGRWDPAYGLRVFPPPGLESVVVAQDPADRGRLFEAVQRLSAQDPLIDARLDGADHELTVSLYGEVQREVLTARLAEEFGIAADVLESRTVLVERVAGVGEWALQVRTGNASVAYRVESGPPGSGERYVMGTERGYMLAGPPPRHRGGRAAGDGPRAAGLAGRGLGGDAHQRAVQRADTSRRVLPRPHRDGAAAGPARGGYVRVRAGQRLRGRGPRGVVHSGAARADGGRGDTGPAGVRGRPVHRDRPDPDPVGARQWSVGCRS